MKRADRTLVSELDKTRCRGGAGSGNLTAPQPRAKRGWLFLLGGPYPLMRKSNVVEPAPVRIEGADSTEALALQIAEH